uniref:Uncharacterized protein n=2 Tax=Ixodes scapularis TaxID=6945 RepID=A0A1S4M327_IXOSC
NPSSRGFHLPIPQTKRRSAAFFATRRHRKMVATSGNSVRGAAGVLVSASRILTKALLSDERVNTLLFFSVSVLVVFLCFVVHGLVLQRTRFVRFYLALCAP